MTCSWRRQRKYGIHKRSLDRQGKVLDLEELWSLRVTTQKGSGLDHGVICVWVYDIDVKISPENATFLESCQDRL